MDVILVDRADGVATVTLNRPDRLNALNRPMWPLLAQAFETVSADAGLRCVVLTGAGSSFSPGADISEFAGQRANPAQAADYGQAMERTYDAIRSCPHPVIAAIRGPCTGAGLVLALLCDLRIAAESGRFGAPVAKLGLAMPYPEFAALFHVVGATTALQIVFEAQILRAAEARDVGLVNRVVPDKDFERLVGETVARISAGAPLVHRWHKAFARRLADGRPLSAAEIRASYDSFGTADYREGFQAFLDKRPPRFDGS